DYHVSHLAGVQTKPVMDPAVYHNTAADSGAHKHSQHILGAGRRSLLELGIGPCINVIVDKDWAAKPFRQPRAERKMVKVQMGRLDDHTGVPVERAWRANPDCVQLIGANTSTQ